MNMNFRHLCLLFYHRDMSKGKGVILLSYLCYEYCPNFENESTYNNFIILVGSMLVTHKAVVSSF